MIRTIYVVNENNELFTLKVRDSDSEESLIFNLEGISEAPGTINTTDSAVISGSRFNSSRVNKRNIVLNVALQAFGNDETFRADLYKFFPVGKPITFGVITDTKEVTIQAYTETDEITPFAKVENATISMICPYPFFKGVLEQVVVVSSVIPAFSFPFSNESLTEPLLETGILQDYPRNFLYYSGDVETGVILEFYITGGFGDVLSIYNSSKDQKIEVDLQLVNDILISNSLPVVESGDVIRINTNPGQKSAVIVKNGTDINILNALGFNIDWISLSPGFNDISFLVDYGVEFLSMSVKFYNLYRGV